MEIGWIYYGFSGAIANFVVWISLFFPVVFKAQALTVLEFIKKCLEVLEIYLL
jgi:hypothetical protein